MELKTKYQYTYFIYPYIVKESKYDKYLLKLIKNKNCNIRFLEKEKDLDMYSYFLPTIRQYLFSTFEFSKSKIKKFKEMDQEMQSTILAKYPCTIFQYDLGEAIQGKAGQKDGIFFKIQQMEIICFQTGICFLSIKTTLEDSTSFSDVLNFNYKFRDVQSEFSKWKEYENIKIQTNTFSDIKQLSELIEEITGPNAEAKDLDIDTDRFLTYSYACIEPEEWNDTKDFSNIEDDFFKYSNILQSSYNSNFDKENIKQNLKVISKWKYIRCGFTKLGSTLLASGLDTTNYTKLPYSYENEYLYTYLLMLYKKIYLKKLRAEFKKGTKLNKARKQFVKFTQSLWIQEITNDDTGSLMNQEWKEVLELDNIYLEVKNKYDILYKDLNIEKTSKTNRIMVLILLVTLAFNILNFITLLGRK